MNRPPPIDSCVVQYLRCWIEPEPPAKKPIAKTTAAAPTSAESTAVAHEADTIRKIGFPYEGHCVVFDTETTTGLSQGLRIGSYAIYGITTDRRIELCRRGQLTRAELDRCVERGLFYDPARLTVAEIDTLKIYARTHNMEIYPMREFVTDVFYPWVYWKEALCIGHNLSFDLARLAVTWGPGIKQFRNGFWLSLCGCEHGRDCFYHPSIRVKVLGSKKATYKFASNRPPNGRPKRNPGRFLDTVTLGLALLGPGDPRLEAMGRRFQARTIKQPWDEEHGAPVTNEYLDYAVADVEATWALYQAERALFSQHGVKREIWKIYSEASLGKAYYEAMGVPRFMQQHPKFPRSLLGQFMQTYCGGRAEVRCRLQPVEIILTDFKSQYPTGNALMDLQAILLAETIEARPCADETRAWLSALSLDDLQSPATWKRLRCIVKIRPNADLLPIRAQYNADASDLNIGLNYASSPIPIWYTLADVVASYLLTGRIPEILDAVELVPHGRVTTVPKALFGDERYLIDLNRDDLFTRVNDLRSAIKQELRNPRLDAAEREHLEALQLGLKLLANSTAYGVLVEVNPESDLHQKRRVDVHAGSSHSIRTHYFESPGTHFAGPLGTLIPAAGRLLLALAERLAADRGISYAFCDTDSMAYARPDGMDREDFARRVQGVTDWFRPLSPYQGGGPLLEREGVNDWAGHAEPLYCLAVSAKRYALYNRLVDGSFRVRKFSAHGTGDLIAPPVYESSTPEPCDNVYKLGGARWKYDLWYDAIAQAEAGVVSIHVARPELDIPVIARLTISTWHLYQAHKDIPGIRPFSFITVLPALNGGEIVVRKNFERAVGKSPADVNKYDDLKGVTYYAPFGKAHGDIAGQIRRSDTHELVDVRHKTLNERLSGYFRHPEMKSNPSDGVGWLARRHVYVYDHAFIGKESNAVRDDSSIESGGVVAATEPAPYVREGLRHVVSTFQVADLVIRAGIPRQTVYDLRRGSKPSCATREALINLVRKKIIGMDRQP